ncbi:MAG: hypothetical protein GY703_18675 [Gammaproteobacteria bacterium]|nr:hypothetical protein [Gammaproteobacteria bacterium]
MKTQKKQAQNKKKYGRPRAEPKAARSKRVVTFVTKQELESLEQIAYEEDRSLSAIVHRIIVQHLSA